MVATVASIDVTLRLLGADQFQSKMRAQGDVSEQTGAKVKRSMESIATSTAGAARAAEGLGRSSSALQSLGFAALRADTSIGALTKSFTLLGTAVGGLAGGVALNAFKNYADTATNIANRLATVIPIQSERAAIDQKIFETAQRTRTSYEATANIYSRMSLSAGQLGATQAQVLKVTETTQKALQAGGATVSESASIATQLSQALGSGRLAGDELKSIAENSPVLIQAIAREFSTTVGGLKDMGSQGLLTADRVFKAILAAGNEVDELFAQTKPSIAGGIQQIDNALTRYIGNVDKSLGVTNALVGGLQFVAKNLDTIGDSAALAVAALAGPIGGRLLSGASSRVAAPFRDAAATARGNVASTRSAAEVATAAREAAQVELAAAERARAALESQPRFRQASPDVQNAYTRQASQVDKLREGATKLIEKEASALLKRGEAETVVAQISQAASARVDAARRTLGSREEKLNDLLAKRPGLEQAAASAGATPSRGAMKGYYDSLYKVVDARDKLAETNATIALTKRNIEALDEAISRERSAKTPSDFLPIAQAKRAAELARIPVLTSQRDAQGYDLNTREAALRAAEDKIGQAQLSARDAAGKKLIDLDNQISKQRAAVAGQAEKVAASEASAAASRIASAEALARKQAQLDAAAISASNQRKAAQQALQEAEGRLGGLAGQVGTSAAGARTQAIQEVSRAQGVLNTAHFAEVEALGRVEAATRSTNTAKVAFAGASRAAGLAVSSLIGFLGGPLGAALTAASVGFIGYELYTARANATAEKHAEALKTLIARTAELNALRERGSARSENERQQDAIQQRDAARGVNDIRNKALSAFTSATAMADSRNSLGPDAGLASAGLNDLERAAQRIGVSMQAAVRDVSTLPPASIEAAKATQQLADILTEAARIDPRYAPKAIEAQALAKAELEAAQAVKARKDAEDSQNDIDRRARSRKAVYEADEGGPLIRAPIFSAEQAKREIDATEGYVKTLGESIQRIGDNAFQFPELTVMRQQFQAAVGDIANVKIAAQQLVSGQIVPTDLANAVSQFAAGKTSVEEYATALQTARDSMPNFRPLIDSLIDSANKGLSASAALQELDAKRAALDGSSATININVITRSIGQVRAEDGKAIADQEAAAEKSMLDMASKTASLRLQAAGKKAEAKALELKGQSPGIDLAAATKAFKEQEKLEEQISALGKKGRGGGGKAKKSQGQKDGETLAKKLEELDQDAGVAALNDFDQKTVRFAQSAKVATDQIQAFIAAGKSGDMSNLPPVMQQIYEKMKLLEGVKLAQKTLDELFPARKLARELEELRAASNASPEIAAHMEEIQTALIAKNAPEWASGLSSGIGDLVKSVANGSSTIVQALATMKTKIINLALDAAFKPIERFLTGAFTGGGGGGFLSFLGIGGGGGGSLAAADSAALSGVAMYHGGGIAGAPSSRTKFVHPGIFTGAPKFHSGLTAKEFPAILERGERVLTQVQDRRLGNTMAGLSQAAASRPVMPQQPMVIEGDKVTVQVSNTGASPEMIAAALQRNNQERDRSLLERLKNTQRRSG